MSALKRIKKYIRFLLFFATGVLIFWLIYRDQDIELIKSSLQNDVTYFWILLSVICGLLSHISRALRWNYLIEPLGKKPGTLNTFLAVMVGYIMNLVLPRMGEVARCGVLSRYEKISFARLIGTVVTERIIDVLMVLLITLIAILAQFRQLAGFLRANPLIGQKIFSLLTSPYLIGALLMVFLLLFIFRQKIVQSRFYGKIYKTLNHLKEGVISVRYVKKKGALVFHSLFIWGMYYMMLYFSFSAFEFTSGLSPIAAVTTFVMGSFGMLAPVQGGLGTWHFMTKEALALYGVSNPDGIIFAFVVHSVTTLLIIVLGLLSLIALPLVNREK